MASLRRGASQPSRPLCARNKQAQAWSTSAPANTSDGSLGRVASSPAALRLDEVLDIKSQSVLAPDGGQQPFHCAPVTYTLGATVSSGIAPAAVVSDTIPDRTSYVPGSLSLDDAVLSDGADGDTRGFSGNRVQVALSDLSAPATRIRFQVKIK